MKKKFTKEQKKILKEYWLRYKTLHAFFEDEVQRLEQNMKEELNIECEYFWCDNECVGIGDYNREYELLQREDLE